MSNKIFKSIVPGSNSTIEFAGVDGNVTVYVPQNHGAIDLSASDAPALALAILEAAGHRPVAYDPERLSGDDLLAYIAHRLAVHVSGEAKRTKEAADRETLEGEARILFDAGTDYITEQSITNRPPQRWDEVTDIVRAAHVIVARKARELHGGTK